MVVQPVHETLEDVEGRQSAHTAAVERQQAEACGVERVEVGVGFAAMLGREARRHRDLWSWTAL